ncbi:COMM domain-containing protein 3 isoform X1 [Oncorhynchus nerka]|uniref:COMM domain-containing protein 3 isoform X1 n=1 Tax=Oncorhynchus nerka TaxID=8023 RepID=UPI0011328C14|nr:COMM domain-containing protein 3-like isoform X1 [Oncorhynchus nerka]
MPTVVFSINLNSSATTCILEGVKQNVDKSTVSLCLEDVRFDAERIYVFYITYQYREMPSSYQRRVMAPGVIKNGHVHEVNEPSYLISLNVENINNGGSSEEVLFLLYYGTTSGFGGKDKRRCQES